MSRASPPIAPPPAARARAGAALVLSLTLFAGSRLGRTEPEAAEALLAVVVVGNEAGHLLGTHGGDGLAGRAALARARSAEGTPTRLLAVGHSLSAGPAGARRLGADHLRAVLSAERAIGHLLAGEDLLEPALAQAWRGEGPLGEPTPPLNVLLSARHEAAGRPPWLDVEVAGVPLRVLGLTGERAAEPLRDAGAARAWVAPATALQNLLPAPERCWVVAVDADVEPATLAPALSRLSPCVVIVARGQDSPTGPRRLGDVLVVELARGAQSSLVVTWSRKAGAGWAVKAEVATPRTSATSRAGPAADLEPLLAQRLEAAAPWREVAVVGAERPRHVGAGACAACHGALLVDPAVLRHAEPPDPRDLPADPACFACHVTGYRRGGQRLERHADAFRDPASTPWLAAVSCEACHGPGGDHVLDPLRPGTLVVDPGQGCSGCHDPRAAPGLVDRAPGAQGFHGAVEPARRTRVPPEWIVRLKAAGRWSR